jgi:lipid II:glycine glycyltransferase (peptidoglycan interpeptide bridge formation enzyme)
MELCTQETRQEYRDFVWQHPKGHFLQSPEWGEVKKQWKWEGLIVRNSDGAIRGVMSLLIRRISPLGASMMYSPRGPVCDLHDEDVVRELIAGAKQRAKKNKSYVMKLDPDVLACDEAFSSLIFSLGFHVENSDNHFQGIQARNVFRVPLAGRTEDDVMAGFNRNTRYNIRLAQRKGVEVRLSDQSALPEFYKILKETGERDNFAIRPMSYFKTVMDAFGENMRLYMVYYEGRPIVATMGLHYGDKLWYAYSGSSVEHRETKASHLMQWVLIQWALEEGCTFYDLRGVPGVLDKTQQIYGLYEFKKSFSGALNEFIGELTLVRRPLVHFAFTKGMKFYTKLRKKLRK